ncbi:hypothetical protein [Phenylobacterium soli]|uniref:hypothetical protein n=1 Tax=Phenylobacterium soli TaxID=2170551 RepID=UPI0014037C98|nr:hypothetical protein [Phenylobacterium soli]
MYAIEYFCGAKFGGWVRTRERFSSEDVAAQEIRQRVKQERQADITPMLRRAVAV